MRYGQYPSYAAFLEHESFDEEEMDPSWNDNAPSSIKEMERRARALPLQPGDAAYILPEPDEDRKGADIRSGFETTVLGALWHGEYDDMVYVVDFPDEYTGWEGNWGGPPDNYIPIDLLVPVSERPAGSPDNYPPVTRHRRTGEARRSARASSRPPVTPSVDAERRSKKR